MLHSLWLNNQGPWLADPRQKELEWLSAKLVNWTDLSLKISKQRNSWKQLFIRRLFFGNMFVPVACWVIPSPGGTGICYLYSLLHTLSSTYMLWHCHTRVKIWVLMFSVTWACTALRTLQKCWNEDIFLTLSSSFPRLPTLGAQAIHSLDGN